MKYLVLTIASVSYAKSISRWLWALSVPSMNTNTHYYNGWIEHPENGQVALKFDEKNELLIHPQANAKLLVDQIRQAITENEAIEMENIINQGGKVKPIDFIPTSVGDNILTQQQAEANGWFENENIE